MNKVYQSITNYYEYIQLELTPTFGEDDECSDNKYNNFIVNYQLASI